MTDRFFKVTVKRDSRAASENAGTYPTVQAALAVASSRLQELIDKTEIGHVRVHMGNDIWATLLAYQ